MIMNSEDEKFFEDLSGAKTEADGEYDVELVKASGSTRFRVARRVAPEDDPHQRRERGSLE